MRWLEINCLSGCKLIPQCVKVDTNNFASYSDGDLASISSPWWTILYTRESTFTMDMIIVTTPANALANEEPITEVKAHPDSRPPSTL